jgi:integrase
MTSLAYLERRYQTWMAYHQVPADVQARLGCRRFSRSLETTDRTEAKRRKAIVEAEWLGLIQKARAAGSPPPPGGPLSDLAAFARRRKSLLLSPEAQEADRALMAEEVYEGGGLLESAAAVHGIGDFVDPAWGSVPLEDDARRYLAIAQGSMTRTEEHVDEYIATLRLAPKTIDIKRMNLRRFGERFPLTEGVKRREVQRWLNDQLAEGKAPKTLARDLSDVRGYWRYLQSLQVVDEEAAPLDKLTLARSAPAGPKRQPFKAHDATSYWNDPEMADLIRLGMWTGARIDELCALKVENVHGDYFDIVDAKTQAGVRQVPVHDKLKPTLDRLTKASKDGYVLSGLTFNKFGSRSNAIGKRFGRMKARLGFGPEYVFHSIRKTVSTLLENAGVAENVAADILGHEKPTMTYGLYSGGASLPLKREALQKIEYPEYPGA